MLAHVVARDMRHRRFEMHFSGVIRELGLVAYDPVASHETKRIYGDRPELKFVDNATAALQGADALAIVTEWSEFRSPDFDLIKESLTTPVIFDGRNLYDPNVVKRFGLQYYAIGRGDSVNGPKVERRRRASDRAAS